VEIPKAPDHSEVLAIEICNPWQGTYRLKIEETGIQPYRVTVTGDAPNIAASQILKHSSQTGRMRSYYFAFWIENKEAHTQWLDVSSSSRRPTCPDRNWRVVTLRRETTCSAATPDKHRSSQSHAL